MTENAKETLKVNLEDYSKALEKRFGKGIVSTGTTILEQKKKIISICPSLDAGLSGGIPEGSWVLCSGKPKCGKEQPIDSLVYTPDGAKTIGELAIGNIISTPNGKTAKIIEVFPQGLKPIYKITFSDGDYVEAGLDHLWKVEKKHNGISTHIKTTKELICDLYRENKRPKWFIELPKVCKFNSKNVFIHPYLMGVLLGDGSFRGKTIGLANDNLEIISLSSSYLKQGYSFNPKSKTIFNQFIMVSNGNRNEYISQIKKYGLWNKYSYEKYIPEDYIYNSEQNRKELLNGLLDTDGTVSKRGHISYCTTSKIMATQVKFIVNSLGGLCKISEKQTSFTYNGIKKFGKLSYNCHIRFNDTSWIFNCINKKLRLTKRFKLPIKRSIANIEFSRYCEAKCIMLDSKEHLYLTDNFVVTHNSTTSLHFAKKCQDAGKPVFYLDIEGRIKEMILRGIPGLDPSKITIIQSQQGNIIDAEKYLSIGEDIVKNVPGCLLIIDSSSALCAASEQIADITGQTRNQGPKLLASFCRKLGNIVPVNNTIIWVIQHLIANTSGYGSPFMEDGGNKIVYQGDVKIRSKGFSDWKRGEKQIIGQMVKWDIEFSALGPPGAQVESYIRYGQGIDELWELSQMGIEMGIIEKGGAWYSLASLGIEKKVNGQENVCSALSENPDALELLKTKVKELL